MKSIKIGYNRTLKIFKKFLKNTILIYQNDKLIFWYFFGVVINGFLLRLFTIGKVFVLAPLFADIFVSLFFISFYFLLKPKAKNRYLLISIFVSLLVCISNTVYYLYYNSFISITFVSFVITNHDTGEANVLGELLNIKSFLYFWLPIFLFYLYRYYQTNKLPKFLKFLKNNHEKQKDIPKISKKNTIKVIYTWLIIIFIFLAFSLKSIDYARLSKQWNREFIVERFGIYLYQVNDIITSIQPKMAGLFGSDRAYKEVANYYENNPKNNKDNKYKDIFKGKNVIAIHAESIQYQAMTQKFHGNDVTPNLNKLANEGISFTNFYSQSSFGTSSDTEFTLATSILPVKSGTVFINYSDKEYKSYYNLLKDEGYYIFSMHGNTGDFWNRNIMHKNLGYDVLIEKSSYEIDEKFGLGISDKSFMLQSVEKIEKIAKEHDKFYGTLITLSNHTPFADVEYYGEFPVSMSVNGETYPYMEGTKLGNYYKSVHYSDEQIGLLIKELDKKGLLDDTVILIYGDHDAKLSRKDWNRLLNYDYKIDDVKDIDDPNYVDIDYYFYELNRSVPFIIWSKNMSSDYKAQVSTVAGMYDVMPTLGNMLGINNPYALGNDLFSLKDNLVPFANGNFITNYVYYRDTQGKYIPLVKDIELNEDYIEQNKKKTDDIIKISNDIIIYNYFGSPVFKNKEE